MKGSRMYIVTSCISFTIVMLLTAICKNLGFMDAVIEEIYIYKTFIVCASVSGAMFLSDYFMQDKSDKAIFFVRMIDMYIVVFSANIFLFNIWQIDLASLVFNAVLLLVVFILVYVLLYLKNKSDEININKKIKERNKKNG